MRGAIERQVKDKMAVTADTREFVDAVAPKGIKQAIPAAVANPDSADVIFEQVAQQMAALFVQKFGKRLVKDTVKGARAVLDSI